jgi:hypothetical protein
VLKESFPPNFAFAENHVKPVDMSGGNSVVGLWPKGVATTDRIADPGETLIHEQPQFAEDFDEDAGRPPRWPDRLALGAAVILGGAWLGAAGFSQMLSLNGAALTLSDTVAFIAAVSPPLALLLIGWMLFVRSSRTERRRFRQTSEGVQRDIRALEATLSFISTRLDESREALAGQSDTMMALGVDAASRLQAVTQSLAADIEAVGRQTQALTGAASSARGDLAILLSNLPKANIQTRQMITALQEAGLTAHEKAGALDAQLSLLTTRGKEADEIAGNAAQKLAAHLSRMEGVSEVAGERLEQAAGQMTDAVDEALDRAAQALETARQGMEAQGAAMTAMVEQNHAAMAKSGADSAEQLGQRIETISAQIAAVAQTFAAQDEASKALTDRLNGDIDSIEQRFALLETGSVKRTARLSSAVKALTDHAEDLKSALAGGGDTANSLVERVESLMTALDAAAREIDETIPAAYARLEAKAKESMATVSAAAPLLEEISGTATTALERLAEADEMLSRQQEALASMSSMSAGQLEESRKTADALSASIAAATNDAERLAQSAAPQLVEALLRVRETAAQASENAKAAFAEIIPQSARALGEQSKEALAAALTAQVETQMAEIARTTEQAVSTAQQATDTLMRQMLTISETSASLEARIAEARDEVERGDQAHFARRVALLIESLNSTAIDVTKILSNDVTDTAWAAYLKGDRGIFTRRAVRLLDSGEVREIARHYEEDPEFREQVNRYIHDFEAMLRNVLATREGQSLSVALLSSDTGKLYVALAQAIERLRT